MFLANPTIISHGATVSHQWWINEAAKIGTTKNLIALSWQENSEHFIQNNIEKAQQLVKHNKNSNNFTIIFASAGGKFDLLIEEMKNNRLTVSKVIFFEAYLKLYGTYDNFKHYVSNNPDIEFDFVISQRTLTNKKNDGTAYHKHSTIREFGQAIKNDPHMVNMRNFNIHIIPGRTHAVYIKNNALDFKLMNRLVQHHGRRNKRIFYNSIFKNTTFNIQSNASSQQQTALLERAQKENEQQCCTCTIL